MGQLVRHHRLEFVEPVMPGGEVAVPRIEEHAAGKRAPVAPGTIVFEVRVVAVLGGEDDDHMGAVSLVLADRPQALPDRAPRLLATLKHQVGRAVGQGRQQ